MCRHKRQDDMSSMCGGGMVIAAACLPNLEHKAGCLNARMLFDARENVPCHRTLVREKKHVKADDPRRHGNTFLVLKAEPGNRPNQPN